MMARKYIVNGKFLRAPMTGVHRVAAELCNALAALKEEDHPAVREMSFELWLPRDGAQRAREIRLPQRVRDRMTGIPWEQLSLPLGKGRATLLNLCNIGPVLNRDAVTMIHDVQVHLSPASYSFAFRAWYRMVQPAFARRHRMLLTVSEFSKREIVRVGLAPPEHVAVVPNGADHILRTPAEPDILQRLGLGGQSYVVALSTTQAHKNIALLLRAFARLGPGDPTLVLVGGTGREDFVRAGHAIPPNVLFSGRVSDGELRALLENALCLAFPSTTEGFGLPPVEAMLLGCPAIVAPCGAVPEICGDAAIYVAPDDADGWADAILALRRDRERRSAIVAAGHERAKNFSWRAAALTLADILSRTAQE